MEGTEALGEPTNDVSRLREAFASASKTARPGPDCPEPARLWAAAVGELSASKRRELVDHTSTCPACAEAWRLARELAPQGESEAEGWLGSLFGLGRSWNYATFAGAAAAVLVSVAIVTVVGGRLGKPVPPEYRDSRPVPIRSLLPADEPVARDHALLRWSPGPPGSRYQVTVTSEDLRPVAAGSDLEATELLVPAGKLASLPAGAKLLWQVEARGPDGTRVRSDTFIVRLE